MNNYKKLYRVKNGKMVTGVCGGIAEYFSIDPSLVRLGMVLLSFPGVGIVLYVAASIILPEKED